MTHPRSLIAAAALALAAPTSAIAAPGMPAKAEAAAGEIILAKVDGMDCEFCAQSIRKIVGADDAVQQVHVDVPKGQVRVDFKPGRSLDDAALDRLIRKAGYSLVSVDRTVAN